MFPTLSAIKDSMVARTSPNSQEGQAAKQRLLNYAMAARFTPEMASIAARQATGQTPGIEMIREFENSMFPSMPARFAQSFLPSDVKQQATNSYFPIQSQMANQAINTERQGYQQQGDAPPWSSQGQGMGYFESRARGVSPSQQAAQQAPQQNQQQQNLAVQYQAAAEDAIKRGAPREQVMARMQQLMQQGR
jgi:hypothetical protein